MRGDRPLQLGVVLAFVFAGMLLVGPAQSYLDARARVEVLELKDAALGAEIAHLEQRIEDLHDPAHIELVAREQQGFTRPGDVVYAIVVPEIDRPLIEPTPVASVSDHGWPWSVWEWIVDRFGRD